MMPPISVEKKTLCPSCGQQAKRVSPVTLRALLKEQFAAQISSGDHSCCDSNGEGCNPIHADTGWRFCNSPDCDVVYFSEEGNAKFTKSQLKVPVGVKETSGERTLCYCFGHSVASIKNELSTKSHTDALDDIRTKMKDPGCHCETSNPSGSCCLGSVSKGIQVAQEELCMNDSNLTPDSVGESSTACGENIAKVGTLISAIMASACCWLPLLLLAVGVSGAGIAATLEPYRPLFMVVTFGFLGAAFYFTYRPKQAVEAKKGCCDPAQVEKGTCCPPTGLRRFNMMALNKVMLWAVTVLAVAFLFFPSYVGLSFGSSNNAAVTENMNQAVFKIEGMTCEGCSTTVAKAIRLVPGVLAVEVSFEKGQAVVGVKSGDSIPRAEILTALKEAGYSGEFLSAEETSEADDTTATEAKWSMGSEGDKQANNAPNESLRQTVLNIKGMTCEGCATGVSEAIRNIPGITAVQIDFKEGRANVQSPACCTFPKDAVLSAVEKAGFKGEVNDEETAVLKSNIK